MSLTPIAEVYEKLKAVIATDSGVRALAEVVDPVRGVSATERRKLDEGDLVRIALIPGPGGSVRVISSSSTRIVEKFRVRPTTGYLSHTNTMSLKFALIHALNKNRTLGLAYVENVVIDTVSRESTTGTEAVEGREPSWEAEIEIAVSMLLDRKTLPIK